MRRDKASLVEVLSQRLRRGGPPAQRCFDEASEVIVFGSMSVGLDRPGSDMDVLCIGGRDYKLKSKLLDLIAVPLEATRSPAWLQGELATHVGAYGTWIKGTPRWKGDVSVGSRTIDEKRRRVSAFMRALQSSWFKLEECFRAKYSIKLRRETQRLMVLERGVPVPPTRMLDEAWASIAVSPNDVCGRLWQYRSEAQGTFLDDLVGRVYAHLEGNRQISN